MINGKKVVSSPLVHFVFLAYFGVVYGFPSSSTSVALCDTYH